ncbi:exodeoxyribonuclease V subunit gamma [Pseudomonas stutzeri]|jgi:exodeoxyribonuclease V gamma subunit|uniref:RecBCD enzyme subunit RecC n=1 Tax=Stutzerimonas stutzeri NF13 TaxID=1212548 RepID=M2UJ45_STUST|nr:exodeoxyribonuclease V subunit gamma [Stutzerimonas stutzeri]EMD98494.1 exodeoxyribonuclease V subunit gamma [Stutzerimonas stutzeri NF13]MBK3879455.1 exodeoxyribonuclease V subunit gamma [Stutzerimonas stutzeri]MCQ4291040.1 exodeoxyribonuclease V subunit gamma [Stutzerimonas stutzeri]WOF77359.1 exodeoxyribonuclease V subunit gamma [Pseudomonas sp. FeN3W]
MLSLYHAPDLETLGELATRLLAQPLADPFAPALVVAPSQGMGRWLTLELARKQGIAMQLEIQLPATFVWDLSRTVLGSLPEQSAFSPTTLTWRLYGWLCEPANLELAPRLAQYLNGGDERRRLSLAAKIADVFDQYLLYRDDWLAAWERGHTLDLGPDEAWQALLWRELTKDGHPHRARLLGDLLQRLYRDEPLPGLPERLLVFGISSLPPHHLRVLDGLARHIDVVVCALNPSREAWGEIRDIRELARQLPSSGRLGSVASEEQARQNPARERSVQAVHEHPELGFNEASSSAVAPQPSGADDWYLDVGHPLLASLGKQGRDFFDSLFSLTASEGSQELGLYSEDEDLHDDSLLHALQNDILRLRTRQPDERITLAQDDRSLEVHIAHSPLREVEILHDQLLARFAAGPALTPDQVVVLTPDIERYAPFIEAVFAPREGSPRIPYSLADRSLRAEVPLIEAFLELLLLAQSRFAAEEILAWLEQPAIARRAGIEGEDLPLLRDWLREAGMRWGRDGSQRARLGLPDESAFTWRQGLDRLLLGFAAPPQLAGDRAPLLGEYWPLDALEGARGQLLGRLVEFVERLGSLADQLARPRALAEWADDLQVLIDTLFDEREAGDTLLLLSQACAALRDQAQAADLTRPIELELVHQQLSAALQQGGGASGFLTGAVTFCTMVPMRSLPFRVVCLLGLDDGAFPRRTPPSGFDLIGRHPRRGDRARRLDDRYLLLETLLSAREALYLSYVGRDPRDNAVLPPSVLLSEVLEAVDMTAVLADGAKPVSQKILIAHPLQPFSPRNFGDAPCAGYSLPWFRAAQRLAEPPQAQAQAFASLLAEPDEAWLTIEPSQLLQCFRHPARFLLEQRLGLRLAGDQESLASDEPFDLEMPAWNGLRRLSLQAMEHGWSDEDERRMACAAGWLPTGELGQALWGKLRGPVRAFAPRLFELRPDAVPEPLPVDITLAGVRIHGWLDGVTPAGLFGWKLGRLGEWDLAPFWLRHLLLNLSATPNIERHSLMLSPAGDWQLGPLANAAELLEPWMAAYRSAIREPLPLLPRSSHAFAKGYRKPARGSEPLDCARKRAREAWLGAEFSPIAAEAEDPWNALAFRDREPLDERFESLAQQLIGPALDALAEDEEQA